MNKRIPTLLATLIASALYSQYGMAQSLASQCRAGIPLYQRPLVQGNINDLPVTIHADHLQGNYPEQAIFSGNVDVRQGNSRLYAEKVRLQQQTSPDGTGVVRTVNASGNVRYDDDQVILEGTKARANLTTKDTNVWQGHYQMVGRQGRGQAQLMKQRDNSRYTILEHGSFTSCLPGSNTWSVVGSEVIHDREEQVAEIWNARFMLGPVPVFYSPYLQLPVGDKRRSGFLIPNAKYGTTNSFEFIVPYYWNIAPNFDATITPHYIHQRGNIHWQSEFRYLMHSGQGVMAFDYLPSDRLYQPASHQRDSQRRWLMYWGHHGTIDKVWRVNASFTRVSDLRYFNDFSSNYGSSTDGYATQKFSLGYAVRDFDATLSTSQFQVFDTDASGSSWRTLPQLDVNFYHNNSGRFDSSIYAQVVRFSSVNSSFPKATRIHVAPTVDLPLSSEWGSIDSEAKLLITHYQQDNLDRYRNYTGNSKAARQLKSSVNRVMPQFKIDGKMIFERELSWPADYTQTLEPRIQYLYLPYRDQSGINNYDSSLLQFDYSGLFRDRSFGGLDRIASANQLTTGITSRFYDLNSAERFNFSLGQIYYFTDSRTSDGSFVTGYNRQTGSLVWSGDVLWHINDQWGLRGGVQYDARLNNVSTGSGVIEYRRDDDHRLQFSYRYASPEYLRATLPGYASARQYQDGISQAGVTAAWPVNHQWALVGAYYYDTHASQSADQMLGVQYSSCCYAIRIGYERKINGWERDHSKYDNVFGFNIELRGLSSYYGLGTQQMLRSNILPYQSAL